MQRVLLNLLCPTALPLPPTAKRLQLCTPLREIGHIVHVYPRHFVQQRLDSLFFTAVRQRVANGQQCEQEQQPEHVSVERAGAQPAAPVRKEAFHAQWQRITAQVRDIDAQNQSYECHEEQLHVHVHLQQV